MRKFLFLFALPVTFGFFLASIGYGVLTEPIIFLLAAAVFCAFCVFFAKN